MRNSKGMAPLIPPPSMARIVGFIVGGKTSITKVIRDRQRRHIGIVNWYSALEAGAPNICGQISQRV
jgi:hypothetical protein